MDGIKYFSERLFNIAASSPSRGSLPAIPILNLLCKNLGRHKTYPPATIKCQNENCRILKELVDLVRSMVYDIVNINVISGHGDDALAPAAQDYRLPDIAWDELKAFDLNGFATRHISDLGDKVKIDSQSGIQPSIGGVVIREVMV